MKRIFMDNNEMPSAGPDNENLPGKSLLPVSSDLQEAKDKLEKREKTQEIMVEANKIIRKNPPDQNDKLLNLGISQNAIDAILNPRFGEKGFPRYKLTNNSAEIRRLRARVGVLEAKEERAKTQGNSLEEVNGVKIIQNFDADRVQLAFKEKPEEAVIQSLHSAGFHFSYTNQVWQRKLTNRAILDAHEVVKMKR